MQEIVVYTLLGAAIVWLGVRFFAPKKKAKENCDKCGD